MTADELKRMPKIDLHCHLDGSLSKKFLQKRLARTVSSEEIEVSSNCNSLEEYLEKFALPCSCIQDEEGLEEAGEDILETMSLENVCYAEIRFAPLLSVTESMDCAQVIAALLRGLEKGKKKFGVEYNVITCAMRNHSEADNFRMIQTAREFLGAGVCAVDLAGAEAQYPMSEFMELFRKTKTIGMPFTIHAGECQSAQNIEDALTVGADRIGHGIAMQGNERLKKIVRESGIGVEMCPISNLQTKAVKNPMDYPIREFLDAQIAVSVNTDNRTVSNTSLTKELQWVQNRYGINDKEVLLLMENAAKTAFLEETKKTELCRKIRKFVIE